MSSLISPVPRAPSYPHSGQGALNFNSFGSFFSGRFFAKRRVFSLAATAALMAAGGSARAAQFSFVNDPVTTDTPPFIQLLGINNAGTIVGYTGIGTVNGNGTVTDPNRGFILNLPSAFTPLDPNFNAATCATCQAQVFGISGTGTTTDGFYIDAGGVMHGFLDVGNGPSATVVDDTAGVANQLLGLNQSAKEAAGFYTDAAGVNHAYTYDTGTGVFTLLPTLANGPGAGDSSQATGVNDAGWVTGFDSTTGTGFLFNPLTNAYIPIDASGAMFTQPLSLNDAGVVVGTYADAAGVSHGFVYANGSFQTIDPNGAAATVLQGINASDQIVGFYTNANNATIGLLTAVPEPSTFGLIGLALGLLVCVRIRSRRAGSFI